MQSADPSTFWYVPDAHLSGLADPSGQRWPRGHKNATGRLVGTLLSGVLYLAGGLEAAMWGSAAFAAVTWLLTLRLPALPAGSPEATEAAAG